MPSAINTVVLYWCETWSLILREEHRLRLSENRVLRRIFGPKRDEVTGEWRKLHNEELRDLYSSPRIIRIIKCVGTSVRTTQETHYVSGTGSNRLMLFAETAVYCENHTEHINTLCGYYSSYLTGNTLRLRYRVQPVNAVCGNSCLL
jgi:hypothetical protein